VRRRKKTCKTRGTQQKVKNGKKIDRSRVTEVLGRLNQNEPNKSARIFSLRAAQKEENARRTYLQAKAATLTRTTEISQAGP